jgi:signal transduction histidine kinase
MAMDALGPSGLRQVLDAGRGLVSRLELDAVLEQLLRTACEVTGARYAAIGVLDAERRRLERFLTHGIDPAAHRRIGDLPHGRGVLGVLIEEPRPLRLGDVADHPASYGFPPHHPPMATFLGVPVLLRGEAWGNLYLTERAGGPFTEADEQAAVVLADWAAIAVDNARLFADAQGRREDAERALRRLEATTDVVRALGSEVELERVLALVAERGRALVGARAVVVLLDEDEVLRVAAAAGDLAPAAAGGRVPPGDLHGGLAALGIEGADDALVVPLVYRGVRLGVLAALDRLAGPPALGPEDAALLDAFASSAATAVAMARTVAEDRLRQSLAAAEEERRRWARELHDETLQALGGLRLGLADARRRGPEHLPAAVDAAVAQLEQDIGNLRSLITELRPAALDDLGVQAAIRSLADRLQASTGARVEAQIDPLERLSPELEVTVYRVVQEALSNAARHAGARNVEIRVRRDDGEIRLRVRDDGHGFDPAEPATGFGLVGIRDRVALARGRLELTSAPGAGTDLRAFLPVPGAAPGGAQVPGSSSRWSSA